MKRPALSVAIAAIFLVGGFWLLREPSSATPDLPVMTVYKSPTCGCCVKWIDHLEENGFVVKTVTRRNMNPVKAKYMVPASMESCHTGVVDGYVVEGHVPAREIKRLLAEGIDAAGIAVPGMPIGSPGMEGPNADTDHRSNGTRVVFAQY